MAVQVAYQQLWDELLTFITRPEYAVELSAGRSEFVHHTGEVFEEDRSFEARLAAFLDWFIFDRPLAPFGEPPVRAYIQASQMDEARAQKFRIFSRTVHGLFVVRALKKDVVSLINLPTNARYDVPIREPMEALKRGDLFEARLVPFEGTYHFSTAFIFHPRDVRPIVELELARQRHQHVQEPAQEVIFTMSRMATRAEHYRNIKLEAIYDFARPPPKVGPSLMKFDRESIARRLGRVPAPALS